MKKNKKTTMPRLANLVLVAAGMIIGTGGYVLFPVAMYAVLGMAVLLYGVLVARKRSKINVHSNLVLMLYVLFLLLNFVRDFGDDVAGRLYLNFFVGICAYLVVLQVLNTQPGIRRFGFLPLLSLVVIAVGLVLELNGIVSMRGEGEESIELGEGLLLRPGGFLNPNMSAALSLIWLYVAVESKADKSYWMKFSCVGLGAFIVAVTQSRAALLALTIYCAYKLYEGGFKRIKYYIVPAVCGILLFAFSGPVDIVEGIYDAIAERAKGDSSSEERYHVIQAALATFAESPIFGRGMRAMYHYFGLGTHNEIIEWLVNFGLVGFVVMLLVLVRFYYAGSFKYLCMCVMPTLLFSHNFFETTAFQVALAYAFYVSTTHARPAVRTAMTPRPVIAVSQPLRRARPEPWLGSA